jgi:threonine dehydrogenase-like Zn-dependent dehydrogenase
MRALVVGPEGIGVREDLPRPLAAPGEVRVRVLRAGVCATDLALARGYMGFEGVPGHEFVGVALDGPLQGRRVVGEINAGCGSC